MTDNSNTINEVTAVAWTTAYRNSVSPGSVRAFLIPLADLEGAINEIKNQSGSPMCRAYLALDGNEEKLVIVGTTQDNSSPQTVYRDMLPSSNPAYSIWDFTQPCPPYCDNASALNN